MQIVLFIIYYCKITHSVLSVLIYIHKDSIYLFAFTWFFGAKPMMTAGLATLHVKPFFLAISNKMSSWS